MLDVGAGGAGESTIEALAFAPVDGLDAARLVMRRCARAFLLADSSGDRLLQFGESRRWLFEWGVTDTPDGETPGIGETNGKKRRYHQ